MSLPVLSHRYPCGLKKFLALPPIYCTQGEQLLFKSLAKPQVTSDLMVLLVLIPHWLQLPGSSVARAPRCTRVLFPERSVRVPRRAGPRNHVSRCIPSRTVAEQMCA